MHVKVENFHLKVQQKKKNELCKIAAKKKVNHKPEASKLKIMKRCCGTQTVKKGFGGWVI